MKYLSPTNLFIVYKIIKSEFDDSGNFPKVKYLIDFGAPTDLTSIQNLSYFFLNLINRLQLKIKIYFENFEYNEEQDEDPGLEYFVDDLISEYVYSHAKGEQVENLYKYYLKYFQEKLHIAKNQDPNIWFFKYIEEAHEIRNMLESEILSCILCYVNFDIYNKSNLKILNIKLKEYLTEYINGKLILPEEKNYLSYSLNEEMVIDKLRGNYEKYGKTFYLKYSDFNDYLGEMRYLDTLLAFELMEKYITIEKLYFKKKDLYCLLKLEKKMVEIISKPETENKITEIYIFKGQRKNSLIVIGSNGNKLVEPKSSVSKNSWVENLYEIAEKGSCKYSKSIEAINYNSKLELYSNNYFFLTKLLKKEGGMMKPAENIKVQRIKNDDEFFKKRKRFKV